MSGDYFHIPSLFSYMLSSCVHRSSVCCRIRAVSWVCGWVCPCLLCLKSWSVFGIFLKPSLPTLVCIRRALVSVKLKLVTVYEHINIWRACKTHLEAASMDLSSADWTLPKGVSSLASNTILIRIQTMSGGTQSLQQGNWNDAFNIEAFLS